MGAQTLANRGLGDRFCEISGHLACHTEAKRITKTSSGRIDHVEGVQCTTPAPGGRRLASIWWNNLMEICRIEFAQHREL
jgi:hypothetical protein